MKELLSLGLLVFLFFQSGSASARGSDMDDIFEDLQGHDPDKYDEFRPMRAKDIGEINSKRYNDPKRYDFHTEKRSQAYFPHERGIGSYGKYSPHKSPHFGNKRYRKKHYRKSHHHYPDCKCHSEMITLVHWKSKKIRFQGDEDPLEPGFTSQHFDDESWQEGQGAFGTVDPDSSCELNQDYQHIKTEWNGDEITIPSNKTYTWFNAEFLGKNNVSECPKKGDGNIQLRVDDKFISKCGRDVIVVTAEDPTTPRFLDIKVTGWRHKKKCFHHHHHHYDFDHYNW